MAGKLTAAFRPAVLPAVDLMLAVPPESSFSSTASLIPADLPRCMKEACLLPIQTHGQTII